MIRFLPPWRVGGWPLPQRLCAGQSGGRARLEGFSANRFYQRRFTRIYPPYAIALIGCFGLIILSGFKSPTQTVSPVASLLASLAYLHAAVFDQPSALNPPVWWLEVEIQFYLLAPLLLKGYFSIGALRSRLMAGLAVTLALIAMLLFLRVGQPVEGRFRLGMATHAYLFAAGIVAADLYTHKALRGVSRWADGIALVGLAGYAMVGLFLTKVDAKPEGGLEATWVALAILVFTAMLFFAAVRGRLFGALMRQPWLRWPGLMCFSIYLVHVPVLQIVASKILPHLGLTSMWSVYLAMVAGGGGIAVAVGAVYFVLVEYPFMAKR